MELSFDTQHGITGLLLSIVGLLVFNILKDILIFAYKSWKNRGKILDENLKTLNLSIKENTKALSDLDKEFGKLHLDLQRAFKFIKLLSGEQYQELKKRVMSEEEN